MVWLEQMKCGMGITMEMEMEMEMEMVLYLDLAAGCRYGIEMV